MVVPPLRKPLSRLAPIALLLIGCLGLSRAAEPTMTLPNSVHPVVARAAMLRDMAPMEPMHASIAVKLRDPAGLQAYADAVSDPNNPLFHQWLTPPQIGDMFGPTPDQYAAVAAHMKANGLTVRSDDATRYVISVSGTAAQFDTAFGVTMRWYRESLQDRNQRAGRNAPQLVFRANANPVQLPASIAAHVEAVIGLENYVRPVPFHKKFAHKAAHKSVLTGPFTPVVIVAAYDMTGLHNAGFKGSGRTIGITSFDPITNSANEYDFVQHYGLGSPVNTSMHTLVNFTEIEVDGGSGPASSGMGEGDLDIQMPLIGAPLANIRLYDAPAGSSGYLDNLKQEVNDNLADVISESYGWSITAGSAQSGSPSFHSEHTMMTTLGITYVCASGDWAKDNATQGTNFWYPSIDPEVCSVGGTVLQVNSGTYSINNEVGWLDSGGGYQTGGFAAPAYQTGASRVSPTNAYRQWPDIALSASGNNSNSAEAYYFYMSATLTDGIGTSFSSPATAGGFAAIENALGGVRLGRINNQIYGFNGRNDIFNDITTGNNGFACTQYWDLVTGWGSPDFSNLEAALAAPLAVGVMPSMSTINAGATQQLTAAVTGTNVKTVTWAVTSGPGSVDANGLYTAPSSIASQQTAIVTATSTINSLPVVSGNGTIVISPAAAAVSGTITLQECVNSAQPITFTFHPATGSDTVMTTTLDASGNFSLSNVPLGTYTVGIKGAKWLEVALPAVQVTGNLSGINATLPGGDCNNDNTVDIDDFNILDGAFGSQTGDPNFVDGADLNCDGVVDIDDFNILAENFSQSGANVP